MDHSTASPAVAGNSAPSFTAQFGQAVADHAAGRQTVGGLLVTCLVGQTGGYAGDTVSQIVESSLDSIALTMQVAGHTDYDSTPEHGMENVLYQTAQRLEALAKIVRKLLDEAAVKP